MSIEIVTDANGAWAVDWSLVRSIVRSYVISQATLNHGQRKEVSQTDWYNPFSWAMPDVVSYEVDWASARSERDQMTETAMADLRANIDNSVPGVKSYLRDMIERTEHNKTEFRNNLQSATRETMQNIDGAVSTYENLTTGARVVRDTSAEIVLVGATFMSGGTAAAFIAGGSAFKGIATYQDTGNVGAAMIETTGSVIMTVIPVARAGAMRGATQVAVSTSERVAYEGAVVFLDVQFEVAKGLVAGDSLQQAVARGGVKVVTAGTGAAMGRLFQTDAVQNVLGKTAIPAFVRVGTITENASDLVSRTDLVGGMTSTVVNTQVIGRVSGAAIDNMRPEQRSRARQALAVAPPPNVCIGTEGLCARMEVLERAIQPAECR